MVIAESTFVEITKPQGNIIVGVIYRPPEYNIDIFLPEFNVLLDKIAKENKSCYLMGDFNINLTNYHCHASAGEFLDAMYSRMFYPLINNPTRITEHTATLIDNIFTNRPENHLKSDTLFTDISDHLPIFSILTNNLTNSNRLSTVTIRDRGYHNVNKFKEFLAGVDWTSIIAEVNPRMAYNTFLLKYSQGYNDCFPLKVVKEKKCWHKPWLTKGLLRYIKNKNILYKRFIRSATVQDNTLYKNYKNKLNHLIRIAKRMYYEQQLSNSKSNIKLTWKILNRIINKNNSKSKISDTFICDDVKITDPLQIANKFCHYFTNIGPNLANKISDTSKSPLKYMNGNVPNSMVFNLVSDNEVINIVNSFKLSSAAGYDNCYV